MPSYPEPVYTIYKITCLINGRYYIGKHKTKKPDDWYYGSSPDLQNDIKKYGKNAFKKQILHIYKKESTMKRKERELVNEKIICDPVCYNVRLGG